MNVLIRGAAGTKYLFHPKRGDSTEEVKRHIEKTSDVAIRDEHLLFNVQELQDHHTSDQYCVEDQSIIQLVRNPRSVTRIVQEDAPMKEVILPASAISLKILEEYLRSHVDGSARRQPDSDPDVEVCFSSLRHRLWLTGQREWSL